MKILVGHVVCYILFFLNNFVCMSCRYMTCATYCPETDISEDPDRNLLSNIIDKVVLAKLSDVALHYYQPLSYLHTSKLTCITQYLCASYPTLSSSSANLKRLLVSCYFSESFFFMT